MFSLGSDPFKSLPLHSLDGKKSVALDLQICNSTLPSLWLTASPAPSFTYMTPSSCFPHTVIPPPPVSVLHALHLSLSLSLSCALSLTHLHLSCSSAFSRINKRTASSYRLPLSVGTKMTNHIN